MEASVGPLWSTYQRGGSWFWATAPATNQESLVDVTTNRSSRTLRSCSRASFLCYKTDSTEFSNQAGELCCSSDWDSRMDGERDCWLGLVSWLLVATTESAGSGTKVQEPYPDIFWNPQNKSQIQCSPKSALTISSDTWAMFPSTLNTICRQPHVCIWVYPQTFPLYSSPYNSRIFVSDTSFLLSSFNKIVFSQHKTHAAFLNMKNWSNSYTWEIQMGKELSCP